MTSLNLFSCRVWHLPVFGFLRGYGAAVLRRHSQQVNTFLWFHMITISLSLLFSPWCEGVKCFSTLLVWALAWSPLSSSFSSFWPAFCQRWHILTSMWGQINFVSCVSNVSLFPAQQKSPFYLFIVGGWSFSLYAIQLVFRNLKVIVQEHWHVALGRPLINTKVELIAN